MTPAPSPASKAAHTICDQLVPPTSADVAVEITPTDLATLHGLRLVDRQGERLIWTSCRDDGRIWLIGTDEELEALSECVAAEANHEDHGRRQQRLDEVFGLLEVALGHVP